MAVNNYPPAMGIPLPQSMRQQPQPHPIDVEFAALIKKFDKENPEWIHTFVGLEDISTGCSYDYGEFVMETERRKEDMNEQYYDGNKGKTIRSYYQQKILVFRKRKSGPLAEARRMIESVRDELYKFKEANANAVMLQQQNSELATDVLALKAKVADLERQLKQKP
jgi:hypothetical protein